MEHDFYNLEEAAKELGCEVNDLLKIGAEGKIEISIYYKGENLSPEFDFIDPQELFLNPSLRYIEKFMAVFKNDIMRVYQENNNIPHNKGTFKAITLTEWNRRIVEPFPVNSKSLFISREALASLKVEKITNLTGPSEINHCTCEDPDTVTKFTPIHSGLILTGWKAIANHLQVSVSTAKRYSKQKGSRWLRSSPSGRPITTTNEIDTWRLTTPKKKK